MSTFSTKNTLHTHTQWGDQFRTYAPLRNPLGYKPTRAGSRQGKKLLAWLRDHGVNASDATQHRSGAWTIQFGHGTQQTQWAVDWMRALKRVIPDLNVIGYNNHVVPSRPALPMWVTITALFNHQPLFNPPVTVPLLPLPPTLLLPAPPAVPLLPVPPARGHANAVQSPAVICLPEIVAHIAETKALRPRSDQMVVTHAHVRVPGWGTGVATAVIPNYAINGDRIYYARIEGTRDGRNQTLYRRTEDFTITGWGFRRPTGPRRKTHRRKAAA